MRKSCSVNFQQGWTQKLQPSELSLHLSPSHAPSPRNGGMLKSSGTSEDSSSLCSIIHHLWLQNSLGSPWRYTLYPDGKTPAPLRACLLHGPAVHPSVHAVPSLPCSHQSHQK